MRDMIFVSHANPEDNEFSQWLSLQLAKEGYPVWCDLTKLLGGEDFWKDIELAIRNRTVKFLYVLSNISNSKEGPLNELHTALNVKRDENLQDFVIPLLIDDLPPRQINIELSRLNAIAFSTGWEKGLHQLIKKLETDNISKKPNFTPNAVSTWWKNSFGSAVVLKKLPEEYISNWFPISRFPKYIYFHSYESSRSIFSDRTPMFTYPSFVHNRYLISFAPIDDLVTSGCILRPHHKISIDDFVNTDIAHRIIGKYPAKKIISILLRLAWDKLVKDKGLVIYALSNKNSCAYFRMGQIHNDTISFTFPDGCKKRRSIVGHKSVFKPNAQATIRYWHFAIQARPQQSPFNAYIIKPHIIFSDNGVVAWADKKRMHIARRSQCRDWWNDDWRDRILAYMRWLAGNNGAIEIKVARDDSIFVDTWPVSYQCPFSFDDPNTTLAAAEEAEVIEDGCLETFEQGLEDPDE